MGPLGAAQAAGNGVARLPNFSALDGTITAALHTPKTPIFQGRFDGVCDLVSLYLFDLQRLSPATGALTGEQGHAFSETK